MAQAACSLGRTLQLMPPRTRATVELSRRLVRVMGTGLGHPTLRAARATETGIGPSSSLHSRARGLGLFALLK